VAAGADLLVSSAGVSVGAYDVVKAVLDAAGGVAFWRVRMRPGKPLAFGAYRGVPFLGLPGNPVSAMVSFERFARPAILKMAGQQQLDRPSVTATILEELHSDGRESYLRAVVSRDDDGYVAITTGSQGSHVMTSLVQANALLIVPEGVTHVPPGSVLPALMIDWPSAVFYRKTALKRSTTNKQRARRLDGRLALFILRRQDADDPSTSSRPASTACAGVSLPAYGAGLRAAACPSCVRRAAPT
jgi:hypothetical protein